jgi:hypothetical protein
MFAKHILDTGYAFGTLQDTLDILHITNKEDI